MSFDQELIPKIYQSILLTWAIAMSWSIAYVKPWIALSITLGMLLGASVLVGCNWFVRRAFVAGAERPTRALLKFGLLKLPALCLCLYCIVRWESINLLAFCVGIALVHFAIVAKVIGVRLVEHARVRES